MQEEEARQETERTWTPTAGGVLSIILGAIFLIPGTVLLALQDWTPVTTVPFYLLLGAFVIIPGIVPIVGGIYALRRRRWGLALAGSIFTLLNWITLGIYGIILLIGSLIGSVDNPGAHFEESDFTSLGHGLIVGLTVYGILGLLTLVFVIRGRREFE